jgi:hypothetical protein
MPVGRKRSHFDDQTDDQWVKDRIVKCSLSSICYSGHSSFTERPWHCGSTADECMSSTVLRDVLTLFQNGGGFDIFILGVPHVAVNIPSYLRFTL